MMSHSKIRSAVLAGVFGCTLATSSAAFSQQSAADNTRNNQQDRSDDRPSADQQSNNTADQSLTRQIRQAILSDKSLSTYAHNVKIISQDGQVTLRGPVRSKEEKRVVESKAAEIAGDGKVTSELQVAPQK
jgi:hyperosmotically inducible periplasmic protein